MLIPQSFYMYFYPFHFTVNTLLMHAWMMTTMIYIAFSPSNCLEHMNTSCNIAKFYWGCCYICGWGQWPVKKHLISRDHLGYWGPFLVITQTGSISCSTQKPKTLSNDTKFLSRVLAEEEKDDPITQLEWRSVEIYVGAGTTYAYKDSWYLADM